MGTGDIPNTFSSNSRPIWTEETPSTGRITVVLTIGSASQLAPGKVTDNSLWAPLKDLPCVSDNDVHYMTFTRDQKEPWWHSEAVRLEGSFAAEDHYATIREMVTIDENFFRNLRGNLRAALNESEWRASLAPNLDDNDDIANVLRDTYRLLTAQYGLQMVTLTEDGG